MNTLRVTLTCAVVALVVAVPIIDAAFSPLHQWRDAVYITAGMAGVIGFVLLFLQPLIIAGKLPGIVGYTMHKWVGCVLLGAVIVHVAGLWITSPPDVIDVLLFRSPTPFSIWGVVAMWAVFAAALLAALRRRVAHRFWRMGHSVSVITAVAGTIGHVWLIDGTLGQATKGVLCAVIGAALGLALSRRRIWRLLSPR